MSVDSINYSRSSALTNENALPSAAVDLSELGVMENNFISLMVAQIQNQDPTNPVDSSQFLQQYASMSQVKSMENMATLQQSSLVLADNLQTLTAAGLVGQEVSVNVESLELNDQPVNGQFTLDNYSGKTSLLLTDSNGTETVIQLGEQAAGKVAYTVDPVALGLKPGQYSIQAFNADDQRLTVEVNGLVKDVRVSNTGPVLNIAGAGSVPFYNIVEFGQRS
ncbi:MULTISPECIES: flagellar hook capping FlgD N-terminal domain-containing protein [Pseudomonas]|uniref:Basal-body rod modification protein FlgD n=1 Tax=Serpens gallinarum TaxID=2763075 RepID=A0ABR8TM51_9PSED|nr:MULTISPECIES: flagellar hook capping FlgD N-terminal domain-containing protein [Pseudomonas]MBD7976851.1 flagellar hook assembly protein FlgD [Serpens gallinarum]MBF0676728.1 flagellar hook assembly protein FlgD [Pseudomonas sp.]